jgi:hypothetical protein
MQIVRQNSEATSSKDTLDEASPAAQDNSKSSAKALPARSPRWVPHRKAEVLDAVRRGSISLGEACKIYELSLEEFLTWQRGDALYGLAGLRATAIPERRNIFSADRRVKEDGSAPQSAPAEKT